MTFSLTFVESAAMLLVELRFGIVEIHALDRVVLASRIVPAKYLSQPVISVSLLLRSSDA